MMNVKLLIWNSILIFFIFCIIEMQIFSSVTSEAYQSSLKECRMYNWKSMTCYWERYFINGEEVPVKLKYKRTSCNPKKDPQSLHQGKFMDCVRPSHDDRMNMCHFESTKKADSFYVVPHMLKLVSDNNSLVKNSYRCFADLDKFVQPDPASTLNVSQLKSNFVTLSWKAPHNTRKFLYSVSYISIWNDLVTEINTTDLRLYLEDLVPHMTYELTIKCIYFNGTTVKGFWSDDARTNFTTLEDVPATAPKLLPGSFMYMDSSKVKILWQPIDALLCNGLLVYTRITTVSISSECSLEYLREDYNDKYLEEGFRNITRMTNSKMNEVLLDLDPDKCHIIYVDQGTAIGFNDSLKLEPIIINSRKTNPSSIKIKNSTVDKNGIFRFSWQSFEGALSHTFYWCLAKGQMECEISFEFEIIPGNSSYFEKQLKLEPYQMMMFASSSNQIMNNRIVHSGLKIITCIYNISSNSIKPPQNLRVIDSGSTWIILGWNPPVCLNSYPPYFTRYVVSYCYLPSCEDIEGIILPADALDVTVDGLTSGKLVKFSIRRQLNDLHSMESTITQALNPDSWWSGISELSLQVSLAVISCIIALITIGILFSCFRKLCEPMKIDVPECKESIFYPTYVIG